MHREGTPAWIHAHMHMLGRSGACLHRHQLFDYTHVYTRVPAHMSTHTDTSCSTAMNSQQRLQQHTNASSPCRRMLAWAARAHVNGRVCTCMISRTKAHIQKQHQAIGHRQKAQISGVGPQVQAMAHRYQRQNADAVSAAWQQQGEVFTITSTLACMLVYSCVDAGNGLGHMAISRRFRS